MAKATQIVDIDVNPIEEGRRRRRAWFRAGVPVIAVALMVAAILGIALYAERANRTGILSLSDDVLATLEARVTLQVSSYLVPAARALRIVGEMIEVAGRNPNRLIERYATGVLREIPQITIVSLADEDGNYLMVKRGDADTIEVTTIRQVPGPRLVTVVRRDAQGAEIDRREDPANTYDPRTRPWYKGAVEFGEALYWTDPYIFAGSQRPGVTVSNRHPAPNGHQYVIGLDLTLDTLTAFLASLEIGRTGRAIIMDRDGLLIATPRGTDAIVREVDGKPVNQRIDQLDDPVLIRAFDAFRIEGPGRRTVEVDGKPFITVASPLPGAASDWLVLMVVPESDFTGFVTVSSRNALAMSLVLVVIAGVLGALLVRQSLAADRNARLLADRQQTLQHHSAAFAALASDVALFDPTQDAPPRGLTETLAEVSDARRASLWRLTAGGRSLRCEDSFDRDSGGHVADMQLLQDELPQYFAQLTAGEILEIADAARDRRTAELHRVVMAPMGSRALLSVPVVRGEQVVGAIWLEDAPRRAATHDFVRAVANMVALRMGEAPARAAVATRAAATPAAAAAAATRSFEAELRRRGIDTAALHAEVYPDVATMVLLFTDQEALAARLSGAERSLSDEIARALQEIAAHYDIPYLKIVGQEVTVALGFERTVTNATGADAAGVLADAAVAMRDRCIALYEDMDRPQDVRIGIDCGMAMGCAVGSEPRVFNLWGEAVRAAHGMAASALPGTVQITQSAYERLRHDFLFRPRGRFYMPHIGDAQTFVLAGRL